MTTGDGTVFPAGSVLSGLTVEALKARTDVAAPVRASLERLGAPRRKVRAKDVELMLAESREKPFSKDGWIFEPKLDGYRMLAGREGGEGRLTTRNGNDLSAAFPELVRSLAALPYEGWCWTARWWCTTTRAGRASTACRSARG